MTTAGPDDDEQWLLLVYRIPAEPTRLRAMVWRRLKALGAVYLQNSAAALPGPRRRGACASQAAARDPRHGRFCGAADVLGGSGWAGRGGTVRGGQDSEYDEILDKCVDFHAGLEKEYAATHFTYGELEEDEGR
jgi:hypothetical protein